MKLRRLLLVFFIVSAFGCSVTAPPSQQVPVAQLSSEESPLEVLIYDELFDGEELHIRGSLRAKSFVDARGVSLTLHLLKEGAEVSKRKVSVASLIGTILPPLLQAGGAVPFTLSLQADGAKEYQLELEWGSISSQAASAAIRKSSVEILSSPKGPAYVRHALSLVVVNEGDVPIQQLTFGVSYQWVPQGRTLDLTVKNPQNEASVSIPPQVVKPGEERSVRIVLGRDVPIRTDGVYEPVVRLLKVE